MTPVGFVYGREQSDPLMYAPTTAVAPTTTIPGETIQSVAMQASNNSNKGKSMANAAIAVTTAGAVATCWAFANSACNYFVGGLVASLAVRMLMGNASGTSDQTVQKVTTADDPFTTNNSGPVASSKPTTDYTQDPEWKAANKVITDLKSKGWKVDVPSGSITTPGGKKFNASIVNSPESMKAAGASKSDIKAFQDAMSKIPAIVAEKSKASDAGDSAYGEDVGGSGKTVSLAAGVGEGHNNFGNPLYGKTGGTVERDPALAEGMAKDYNGTKIGVSADSLFGMVIRRYDYHEKVGSFILRAH